jgi:hypothetical protein
MGLKLTLFISHQLVFKTNVKAGGNLDIIYDCLHVIQNLNKFCDPHPPIIVMPLTYNME